VKRLLLGLIGAGIQRSLSPALHEEEGRHHGLQLHYQLIDLYRPDAALEALPGLLAAVRLIGFAGLNITYPCKQAVIAHLDGLSDEAKRMGAVNTVVFDDGRAIGHNTDGSGWAWGFRRALPDAKLDHVVLVGAGGAGSAVAHALTELGAKSITVVDKLPERAAALAQQVKNARASTDLAGALREADGLVHATPVGMEKQPGMPFPAELLRPELWISEVVYVPLETQLLKAARRIGCAVMDGGHMNVGQACRAFELFTGKTADVARVDAHFRRLAESRNDPTAGRARKA
jgi:shikimate dehydrogenase